MSGLGEAVAAIRTWRPKGGCKLTNHGTGNQRQFETIPPANTDVRCRSFIRRRGVATRRRSCTKPLRTRRSVFYDECQEARLWGKNLSTHLRDVYQHQVHFTIIIISNNYAAKLWTSHERESVQARAFEESHEYILPVRFDDTDVPGILRTTRYIDLRAKSLSALCELILQKLEESRRRTGRPKHVIVDEYRAPSEDQAVLKVSFWDKEMGHPVR